MNPGILRLQRVVPDPKPARTYVVMGPDERRRYSVRRDPEGVIVLRDSPFHEAKEFAELNRHLASPILQAIQSEWNDHGPVGRCQHCGSLICEPHSAHDQNCEAHHAGAVFLGLQDDGNGCRLPLYNDPVTRTTFSLHPGESIEAALARKRAEFVEDFNGRR